MDHSAKVYSAFGGGDRRDPHFSVALGDPLPEPVEILELVAAQPGFHRLLELPQAIYVVHVWRKRRWWKQRLNSRRIMFKVIDGQPELVTEQELTQPRADLI